MKLATRIIGIDPGLCHTGWGVIDVKGNQLSFIAAGCIDPDPKAEMAQRLRVLYEDLIKVLDDYQPDHVAIEKVFVNKNPISSLKLGQARGIGLLVTALKNLSLTEYAPNTVKQTIVGRGHGEKQQIHKMVKILLPRAQMQTNDEADALAIAICHAHHS